MGLRHARSSRGSAVWWLVGLLALVGAGLFAYRYRQMTLANALPATIVSGNGRVESVQVDVSAKEPGRVKEIRAREGDLVQPGQVLAVMDTVTLEAELARAKANVAQQQAAAIEVESAIAKADSELKLAQVEYTRTKNLLARNVATREDFDRRQTEVKRAEATFEGQKARLNTVNQSVEASRAEVAGIQSRIDDATLKAPVRGRVLYRLTELGEVLPAGGKVLTLVNLEDVYMEIYLPAQSVAKVAIGADARIVLDAAPEYAARAKVSFVAPEAQFTPKQVETRSERDKLMFRVKLTLPPERILPYIERIKTGIRGVGYVKLDDATEWPERLNRPFPLPPATATATAAAAAPAADAAPTTVPAASEPAATPAAAPAPAAPAAATSGS